MGNGSWWYRLYLKFATRKQALNTVDQSKSNIQDHYDISNDFYALFLDETKLYSSALFDNESESLSTAQQRKLRALVEPMNLSPTDHVLEIGSGWGGMALYIAKTVGCRVTTITLSQEQYNWTQQRIHDEGLQDLISIQLQDYRTLSGHYDHIVSIEMIEAVGHQFLPDYFKQLNRLVKPGGRVILQAITYPNHDYKRYKTSMDFIKHSIFPGGHLPSLETITSLTRQLTHLRLVTATNIASSYAITLKKWAENLQGNEAAAQKLGFSSDFLRRWHYYFAYCEAAFSSDYLGVYQLQFKRNAV
jgi:cyclopropane-fatty-acyl-phospholipid synthase